MSKRFQVPDHYFWLMRSGRLELVGNILAGPNVTTIIKTIDNPIVLQNEKFVGTDEFFMLLDRRTSQIELTIEFSYEYIVTSDRDSWFEAIEFTWRVKDMAKL